MFHRLTLSDIRAEGTGAVALTFAVPPQNAAKFVAKPGQYLTLRAEIDGIDQRRSYSIASAPGAPLTVGVRAVPGGVFSSFAQGLQAGDSLDVMPPQGRFIWTGQARIILIAAGSGITPMVSIAAAALDAGAEVTLVYGNRSIDTIMFRETLEALKNQHMQRFRVLHILSRETQDSPLLAGRIDGEKVTELQKVGAVDFAGSDGVFLCGPGDMIETLRARLTAFVPPERVFFERFTTESAHPVARSEAAEAAAAQGVAVDVVLDGTTRRFAFQSQDGSVLDAAARAGLELPFSCKGGMCCTCRCKITTGAGEMAVNYALEPWEIEAGFTLACQTRPTTERLVLDFDAV